MPRLLEENRLMRNLAVFQDFVLEHGRELLQAQEPVLR